MLVLSLCYRKRVTEVSPDIKTGSRTLLRIPHVSEKDRQREERCIIKAPGWRSRPPRTSVFVYLSRGRVSLRMSLLS